MKEVKKNILQDIIETPRPKESKTKKYMRMVMMLIAMGSFVLLFIMAAYRHFGG